jgi:glycosyltransferase involved in cell wall biosynthesis
MLESRLAGIESSVTDLTELKRHFQIQTVMDWIDLTMLTRQPLISVVLPTRDRHQLLARAIESVERQTYSNWELLIVDDGSVDETAQFLAGLDHPKIRCLRGNGRGVCAARNVALAAAGGELIAYLDDDNTMHPGWLKAVAWGFEQRPSKSTLYGAIVVDDSTRIISTGDGDLPRLFFSSYDHKSVAINNIADMGCIAHRARIPEARFDESLREMGDWDLFLRLTRDESPLALPALACYYRTDTPNRLSGGPTHRDDLAVVRSKNTR